MPLSRAPRTPLVFALVSVALSAPPAAAGGGSGGFRAGDLYVFAPTYTGSSSTDGAILHVDPFSGAVTQLLDIQSAASSPEILTYDPYRDRLLFHAGVVLGEVELFTCDAAGTLVSLGYESGVQLTRMTPRGDGIVYMVNHQNASISYLDAADQLQVVMDAPGTAPYAFPIAAPNIRRMHYHRPTNALFCAVTSGLATCSGGDPLDLDLYKLSLSVDGSRVVAEDCVQHSVTSAVVGEVPVGLTSGPEDDLLLSASINASGAFPLLVRIDPVTLSTSTFATPDYLASHAPSTSCFSQARGQAILKDGPNGVLRAFDEGYVGPGTVIANGIGSGGAASTLVEIAPAQPLFGLTTDTMAVSLSSGGAQGFDLALGPGQAGKTYLVLGSLSGWNPGLLLAGLLLPLHLDSYFVYTITNANGGVLVSTFGALNGAGQASAALSVPAGTNPALAGFVAHHAAVVFGPGLTYDATTNAVGLTFLP